jgi:hypothetical protein
MKTFQDLLTEGLAIADPKVFKHFATDGNYHSPEVSLKRTRYGVAEIVKSKVDIPSRTFTYNAKDRYFIIGNTKTPYSSIKAYIQMAGGKITKDADKADHIVIDNSVYDSRVYFENAIIIKDANCDVLVTADSPHTNWNNTHESLMKEDHVSESSWWNYGSKNVFDDNALVAIAAATAYPNKLVTPYDLGIATGSITELTEDNIKSVCRMISSSNDEDTKLANHMLGTFDYKASELLTWKFCRELYSGGRIWYLNKRMKAVREFITDVFEVYGHLNETEFFQHCERKNTLTPEIFAYIYKDLQRRVYVTQNPGIWSVKFEMKDKYKQLLKEHHYAEN